MRLKEWRETEGLTQEDLADELGVHPMSVYRWEARTRDADASIKQRLFVRSGGQVEPNDWYDLPGWRRLLNAVADAITERAA